MKTTTSYYLACLLLLFFSCGEKIAKTVVKENSLEELLKANQAEILESLKTKYTSQNIYTDSVTMNSVVSSMHKGTECLWSNGQLLNKSANELVKLITHSTAYGLDSSFYQLSVLQQLADSLSVDTGNLSLLAQAEWEFSKTSVELFTHIKYGFLNHTVKDSLYYQLKLDSLSQSDLKVINWAIQKNNLEGGIDSLEPSFYAFKELRTSWANFLKDKPMSAKRIRVESLKEDSALAYEKAEEALLLYGYLDTSLVKTNKGMIDVLKKFQLEHGLSDDGRIGSATARALSRSNEDRKLSVMASLEKMKWNPIQDKTLFYANIPSYQLKVVEENKVVKNYRTVVGRTINRTPTFSAEMKYLILNPYWHIPKSISSKEILPKLRKDSTHASKKGYRILDKNRKVVDASKIDWSKVSQGSFNYKISQVRSGRTALGKVKFIFTNKYSIYFHDTPSKRLFKNDIRAYSHGCVRVQDPLDLAAYMLSKQDSTLTLDSVQNFTKRGIQKRYDLDYTMRVYIQYFSTEGTPEGHVKFYRDIYKKETGIKQLMREIMAENLNRKNV